jgi:hypothetical protein
VPTDDKIRPSQKRQPIPLDDAYLPLGELAVYSGLSIRKLQMYITDPMHPLPHYRFGSKIEVRRSEFDAWARHYRVERAAVDVEADIDARIAGR